MQLYEIIFGVPVLLGIVLVLGAACGFADLGTDLADDLDADGDADGDTGDGMLAALGLGRVPLVVLAMLLLLLFGGLGLATYPLFLAHFSAKLALGLAWAFAGLFSLFLTRVSSRWFARVLPSVESYASTKRELVGQAGTVIARLAPNEVVLRVLDRGGAELRVRGLVRGAPPRVGETLVVTYYEQARDAFWLDRLSLVEG